MKKGECRCYTTCYNTTIGQRSDSNHYIHSTLYVHHENFPERKTAGRHRIEREIKEEQEAKSATIQLKTKNRALERERRRSTMKIPDEAMGMMAVAASRVAANTKFLDRIVPARYADPRSDHLHRALAAGGGIPPRLLVGTDKPETCDGAFLRCILSPACRACFGSLQDNGIDWTNVVPDTPCDDILGFLVGGGHCLEVRGGGEDEKDTFCSAFDTCVVWDEEDNGGGGTGNTNKNTEGGSAGGGVVNGTDCSKLTSCDWPGMHAQFLGDGVCHENMPGCYNSPVCKYDGGDCCEDTCDYPGGTAGDAFGHCGLEGYACRDPSSVKCQPALARVYKEYCAKEVDDAGDGEEYVWADDDLFSKEAVLPVCSSSQTLYRLVQYDSWGDGWDATILTMTELGDGKKSPAYQGGLKFGSEGTEHVCLSKACYHVTVENGVWGNEISWELRPLRDGAPVLGAGGSPSDCTIPVGGVIDGCQNTCDKSRPDTKIDDPNYKSYKSMEACIELKCLIQVGNCAQDEMCAGCMQGEIPQYCFANDNFNVRVFFVIRPMAFSSGSRPVARIRRFIRSPLSTRELTYDCPFVLGILETLPIIRS